MRKIPKLRFPEFSGEWEEKKIGDILRINHGKSQHEIEDKNGIYPILGTGGVIGFTNTPLCNHECVLIGRKGTINKPYYMNTPFWTVDTLFYSTPKENQLPLFQYYLFQTVNWLKYDESSGVPSLSAKTIESIPVFVTKEEEQQKIADFLSTIDSQIETKEEQIENLEEMKKGFMQKIFSKEVRFKDENGNDYPEWEEKKLGELCNITTGKLDANAMVDGGQFRFYTCAKEYFYINKYAFDTEALLISGNGAHVGYIHYYKGKFNAYQRTYVLDGFDEDILYIKYYLDSNLKYRIMREKKEGNTPYIVMSTLTDMCILLPSLPEQQKIANFLSLFDEKIEIEKEILETLKDIKKGLLQQMFV